MVLDSEIIEKGFGIKKSKFGGVGWCPQIPNMYSIDTGHVRYPWGTYTLIPLRPRSVAHSFALTSQLHSAITHPCSALTMGWFVLITGLPLLCPKWPLCHALLHPPFNSPSLAFIEAVCLLPAIAIAFISNLQGRRGRGEGREEREMAWRFPHQEPEDCSLDLRSISTYSHPRYSNPRPHPIYSLLLQMQIPLV